MGNILVQFVCNKCNVTMLYGVLVSYNNLHWQLITDVLTHEEVSIVFDEHVLQPVLIPYGQTSFISGEQ